MLNIERIEELRSDIRKTGSDQEEANQYFTKILREEEKIYEEILDRIRGLGISFEVSNGDPKWTALVEERHSLLMIAERRCTEFMYEVNECRKKMNTTCESTVEELEQEIKRLETLGGDLSGL